MNKEDLQKLKAAATAVENYGVIRSMALPTSEILALITEIEQARAANGWMPIETAPKDGTPILVLKKGFHPAVARWLEGQWMTANAEANYSNGNPCYLEWNLTHWQPLPIPPQ